MTVKTGFVNPSEETPVGFVPIPVNEVILAQPATIPEVAVYLANSIATLNTDTLAIQYLANFVPIQANASNAASLSANTAAANALANATAAALSASQAATSLTYTVSNATISATNAVYAFANATAAQASATTATTQAGYATSNAVISTTQAGYSLANATASAASAAIALTASNAANAILLGGFTVPLILAAGTQTANNPIIQATETWNNAGVTFTGLKSNITDTASASGSLLLDLQVGGSSKFSVDKNGQAISTLAFWSKGNATNSGFYIGSAADVAVVRDAANALALRNGTNSQTLNVYGTYTDASNYSRANINTTTGGALWVTTQAAGTGTSSDIVLFPTGAGTAFYFSQAGLKFSNDNALDIGASGANRPRTIFFGTNLSGSAGSQLVFGTNARIGDTASGNLMLSTTGSGTGFGLLQLGGTTSSFPALKRNGAGLSVRLADDSADAALTTGALTTTFATSVLGSGVTGQDVVLNLGSGSGPGVGSYSKINFIRGTDHAGMQVIESASDQTLYEFWMDDNPDGGDYFAWRWSDWQGLNGCYTPLYIGGLSSRYHATSHTYYGSLLQNVGAYYTTGDYAGVAGTGYLTQFSNPAKLKVQALAGTVDITALSVGTYSSVDGQAVWIKATSTTQFSWGYGSWQTGTAMETLKTFSTSPVSLSNGMTVTFSAATGAVVGDAWQCRVWKAAANTFGPTGLTGNLTFTADNTYNIGASGANRPANIFAANSLQSGGNITVGASSRLVFSGHSLITDPGVDGNLTLSNNAATSFGLLQFGGTTSSFPALKRSTTALSCRLADDSGDAAMVASVFTGQVGLTAASAGYHNWSGRSVMRSPVDGQITLLDSTETTFTRLNLGGTTSSFPALKRNGTAVDVRLADDSGYGQLNAGLITSFNGINTANGTGFYWTSRSSMTSPADGNITFTNNAGTAFGLLQFGGTTSSFPALKRNGVVTQFRLADDSAYAGIRTSSVQFSSGTVAFDSTVGDGGLTLTNAAGTDFTRLTFGGTTSSFPAIKRNGAGVEFKLGDDSGYASLGASSLTTTSNITCGGSLTIGGNTAYHFGLDAPQTLTDAATITPDCTTYNNFKVTLGGNRTLANATNVHAGQTFVVSITQDGTGSRTLSYGGAYDFGGAGTPTLSTAAGKVDELICYVYDAVTPKYRATLNKGS